MSELIGPQRRQSPRSPTSSIARHPLPPRTVDTSRRLTQFAGTVLLTVCLAACTYTEAGKPSIPAPYIKHPLDATHYIHKSTICELLSKPQVKRFEISPPKYEAWKTSVGPQCHIEAGEYSHELLINIDENNSLRKTYTNKKNWSYFKSNTIEDYPVAFGSNTDYRDMGGCTVTLGITNTITATIIYDRPDDTNEKKSCRLAAEVRDRS